MIRSKLFVVLSLFIAGCASGSSSAADPSPAGGGDLTIASYAETYLPREAYFAKFEIVEGNAAILYPTRARDIEPIGPGNHRLPSRSSRFNDRVPPSSIRFTITRREWI